MKFVYRKRAPILIYTPAYPDPENKPDKEPYIIFKFAKPMFRSIAKIYDEILLYGMIDSDDEVMTITITGSRKISRCISIFNQQVSSLDKVAEQNKELLSLLLDYQKQCDENWHQKPKKSPPTKSKSITRYEKSEQKAVVSVSHTISHFHKVGKKGEKEYIFKENPTARSISELEVFNGLCYRILLGEQHPKVKAVHDEKGVNVGLVSEKLPQFESFHDRFQKGSPDEYQPPTPQELLDSEIVKVWAAAYVEEDSDLHGGNYGFALTPSGKTMGVKIDDDLSTWEMTAKYKGIDPKIGSPECKTTKDEVIPPSQAFPVTSRDIESFPRLNDAKPNNWVDAKEEFLTRFNQVINKKKFQDDKYYLFLKRILIPDSVYHGMANAAIRSDKKKDEMANHKIKKTAELRRVLFSMPAFKEYLKNNPKVIDKIVSEFDSYNKTDAQKEKYKDLRIDLAKVRNDFKEIQLSLNPPGYFKRNPKVKKALIGGLIGVVVGGAIGAVVFFTGGLILPVLTGAAASIGTGLGLTGGVATGVGWGVLASSAATVFSIVGAGFFYVSRAIRTKSTRNKNRVVPENQKDSSVSHAVVIDSTQTQTPSPAARVTQSFTQKNSSLLNQTVFKNNRGDVENKTSSQLQSVRVIKKSL